MCSGHWKQVANFWHELGKGTCVCLTTTKHKGSKSPCNCWCPAQGCPKLPMKETSNPTSKRALSSKTITIYCAYIKTLILSQEGFFNTNHANTAIVSLNSTNIYLWFSYLEITLVVVFVWSWQFNKPLLIKD